MNVRNCLNFVRYIHLAASVISSGVQVEEKMGSVDYQLQSIPKEVRAVREESNQTIDEGRTRRHLKDGARVCAAVAASLLPILNLRGTGFAALMYNKLKRLSIVFIVFISFPGLAFAQQPPSPSTAPATKLVPPAHGKIPVAFIIGRGAETIDVVGPWEVFQFAFRPSPGTMSMEDMELFQLYTVSDSKEPVRLTGGMQIIPDYTFANAPEPKVVVVPATTTSPELLDWIRKMTKRSDVVMSVCLGAYQLAAAGVLSGKQATTNAGAYADIQKKYPDVHFLLNRRWVQSDPVIFTSGATGAGIDLALHIVELYFGHDVAARAAGSMNYPGKDWEGDGTDSLKRPLPSDHFSTGVLGDWQGEVVTKEGPLQLAIHIWPYPNDTHLVGTADLLNRDARDLFIDPIALNGPDLHFEIHNGASTFDGKLNAQGTAIEGNWKQSGTSAPLILKRMKK